MGKSAGVVRTYTKNKKLTGSTKAPTDHNLRKRVTLGAWKPQGVNEAAGTHTLALAFRNCVFLYKNGGKDTLLC